MSNIDELVKQLKKDIKSWEGQELEFMEDYPANAHELAKEIAAFATSNPGTIYLGISENKNISGINIIRELGEQQGKDSILNRIAGLTQNSIKPSIIVTINFINCNGNIVVKISIPKGEEPVYFTSNIAYIRILTASDRATPEQIKELYRQYFLMQNTGSKLEEDQEFLKSIILQLSDIQIIWYNHDNKIINPDRNQMMYDLGATGRILIEYSINPIAKKIGIDKEIEKLGEKLEEMKNQKFYLDGGKSWKEFKLKGNKIAEKSMKLNNQLLKNLSFTNFDIIELEKLTNKVILEFKNKWKRREKYFKRNELPILKDEFRRISFTLYRLGVLLTLYQSEISSDLIELAKNLSEMTIQKSIRSGVMFNQFNVFDEIGKKCNKLANKIIKKINT